ncbi:asparagine synthase (glutamine-hydrolyzing) [Bradyrhizobium sp. ORS 111]|uniref:asparagine synthase (glutamine-hydrolyzing) n=1 Tax=Bradyrhizobium sp. ORS 111 TaxID=1685958 RepID=UPI00388D8434
MCGINGIFAYHAAASVPAEAELLATRDSMRARGPDGAGVWWSNDRRFGFANRRLAIQDLSEGAAQPMMSADRATVVSFNGELYNCRQLRAELERDGVRLRTSGDTEILLHLYARHGAAMVHRLRGMFAFAIWDEVRQRLFLARDPYGIKPLYTADDGWTFRFASQVKALLAGGRISRDPEPAGVVGFHLFGSVPEPFTLYRDVRALPAGHTQWVDWLGPHEPKPFANLAAVLAEGAARPAPRAELRDLIRTGVLDSVRAHLAGDVEVGLFLSAGIDSGALLGLMRDAGHTRVRAITLGFDEFAGTSEDEVPIAADVSAQYGAQHLIRRVSEAEFRADLACLLEAMDQPSIDGVNMWFVAKSAREAGLKVALSGIGGDELLAGYPSFRDLPRWRRYYGPLAALPGFGVLAGMLIQAIAPQFARRRPKALGMFRYANSWPGAYLLRRGLYLPEELSSILDRDLVREGLRRLRPLSSLARSLMPDPLSDCGRVRALEAAHYMRNQLLRDADWAGMAHSVEVRVPLVDFDLLRTLSPALAALGPGEGKTALASAPTTPLPKSVVARAKTGFVVPTGRWVEAAADRSAANVKGLASREWSRLVLARVLNGEAVAA